MTYVRELVFPPTSATKFWTIAWDGAKTTTVTFGKIGSSGGKPQKKKHKSDGLARAFFYKTSNTKLEQGYVCRHTEPSASNGYIKLLLKTEAGCSNFVDIHPTTHRIAIGGPFGSNKITLVDLATGGVVDTIDNPGDGVRAMRFSRDGKLLAWQDSAYGPVPHLLDLATRKVTHIPIPKATGMADGLMFDDASKRLLVVTPKKIFVVETAAPKKPIFEIANRDVEDTASAALSADGKRVAFTTESRHSIDVHDVDTKKIVRSIPLGAGRGAKALRFTPDGRHLIACSVYAEDHSTRVYDVTTGKRHLPKIFADASGDNHFAADVTSDGKWLVTSGYFSVVEVRGFKNGKTILSFHDHYRRVFDARFSGDGKYLLTADYNAGFLIVHELSPELLKKGFNGPRF